MLYGIIFGVAVIVGSLAHQFWWGVGTGVVIDLVLLLVLKYGSTIKGWIPVRKGTVARATTPASHGEAKPRSFLTWAGKWFKWFLILVLVLVFFGWCWYSFDQEVGYPWRFVANSGYRHPTQLAIFNLKDQRVCDPGLRPGRWKVDFPQERYWETAHVLGRGRPIRQEGFFVLYPDGQKDRLSFMGHVMINDIPTGTDERVTIDADKCFKVSIRTTVEAKRKAVVYGNPLCSNPDACVASAVPKPGLVTLLFYN